MSIKEILRAKEIICKFNDKQKLQAVDNCISIDAPIPKFHPVSILKRRPKLKSYLNTHSALLISLE